MLTMFTGIPSLSHLASSPTPPHFPGVQFDSLPTDRRALVSERLEQANARRNERVFEGIQ